MIVTCPNCGARYSLDAAVVARGARLRCAECQHRWVPEVPTSEPEVAGVAPAPAPGATAPDAAMPPAPVAAAPASRPVPAPGIAFAPPATGEGGWALGADLPPPGEAVAAPPPGPEAAPPAVAAPEVVAPEVVTPEAPADDAAAQDDSPPAIGRTIIALVIGSALAIAAAGLWVGGIDPARVPGLGPVLARLQPPAPPLKVSVRGIVSPLPGGGRLLEVTGTLTNTGSAPLAVPPLAARLSSPSGITRRWTIPAPVAQLAPGATVVFTSSATGFPAHARTLGITPGG